MVTQTRQFLVAGCPVTGHPALCPVPRSAHDLGGGWSAGILARIVASAARRPGPGIPPRGGHRSPATVETAGPSPRWRRPPARANILPTAH